MKKSNLLLSATLCLALGFSAFAAAEAKKDASKDLAPINKKCPVENEDVDPTKFVIYKGKKVAFCCDGCDKDFNKDPEKFMKLLADKGDDNTVKKDKAK
jgi:YHS domain-containing protein